MGSIKDLVDLVTQLANSVKDRKIAEALMNIQSQVLLFQAEQAALHEVNIKLREERLALTEKMHALESQNKELASAPVSIPEGAKICPNCSSHSKPFVMTTLGAKFRHMLGASYECAKCKYRTH